jgi:hypothetical protein
LRIGSPQCCSGVTLDALLANASTSQILHCALSRGCGSEVGTRKKYTTVLMFMQASHHANERWLCACSSQDQAPPPQPHSDIQYMYLSCVSGHPDRNSTQRLRHILALGRSTKRCSRPPSRIMQDRAAIQLRHYCPTTEVLCFMTKRSKYLKNIATSNRVIVHAPNLWIFHTSRPLHLAILQRRFVRPEILRSRLVTTGHNHVTT